MRRRDFIHSAAVGMVASSTPLTSKVWKKPEDTDKEFYEFRTYELTSGGQKNVLSAYFGDVLIPALNRLGCDHVGVFQEIGNSEPPIIYILIPYPSNRIFLQSGQLLQEDELYRSAGLEFHSIPVNNKVFSRYETRLFRAFDGLPKMITPEAGPRIFELRTYEGYSDDAVRRKIKMFNEGELELFFKTGLHPVFFGEAIAGKDLPYLTYMLTFEDMIERDANWKAFIDHPEWKRMAGMTEFADTVSKIHRTFLEPLDVSQV